MSEWVVDASVLAKCMFDEEGSALALERLSGATDLLAPDFILVELASIAAKKVRRGEERRSYADEALGRAPAVLTELVQATSLAAGAFRLATTYGVSVYDGLYLQLAVDRSRPMLTADLRLVARARGGGLERLVAPLDEI